MIIVQGEVYLKECHIDIIKKESELVRKRYHAVVRTPVSDIIRITRQEAADMIDRSRRQLQRIVKRYREEGIRGLRFRSKRPHTVSNKTPVEIENRIINVRKATGFGSEQLANIVNESLNVERRYDKHVNKTTAYNILTRHSLVDAEKKMIKEYKSFERDRPDELLQADLTRFNGVPILTIEDDHSRKLWAARLDNETDDNVVDGMKRLLHNQKYDSLLTDNGSSQFSRKNSTIRKYCDQYLTGKHIWTSIHHPQTMGNLKCSEGAEEISDTQIGKSLY